MVTLSMHTHRQTHTHSQALNNLPTYPLSTLNPPVRPSTKSVVDHIKRATTTLKDMGWLAPSPPRCMQPQTQGRNNTQP